MLRVLCKTDCSKRNKRTALLRFSVYFLIERDHWCIIVVNARNMGIVFNAIRNRSWLTHILVVLPEDIIITS